MASFGAHSLSCLFSRSKPSKLNLCFCENVRAHPIADTPFLGCAQARLGEVNMIRCGGACTGTPTGLAGLRSREARVVEEATKGVALAVERLRRVHPLRADCGTDPHQLRHPSKHKSSGGPTSVSGAASTSQGGATCEAQHMTPKCLGINTPKNNLRCPKLIVKRNMC